MNLVDTSGWIEYFFAEPNARFFAPSIEATDALIVPVVCLYATARAHRATLWTHLSREKNFMS